MFVKMLVVVMLLFYFQMVESNVEVAGSVLAEEEEFPHLVSVFTIKLGKRLHYCAGGLINSYTVLLAAHCFDNIQDPRQMYIQAGTKDVANEKLGITARVTGANLHPKWDKKLIVDGKLVNDYDIAVIYLDRNITENGKDIRYMEVDPTLELVPSTLVDIAGWGYYKDKSYKRDFILRKTRIPIQKADVCKDCKDELMICAGNGKGKDACHGDSGAPLVRNVNGLETKRWSVVGLTSFGPNGCGKTGSYGVYARVARFQEWIWSVATRPPPPLEGMGYLPFLSDDDMLELECYNMRGTDESACGGHGSCIEYNNCVCDSGWTGVDCVSRGIAGVTVKHVGYSLTLIVFLIFVALSCHCFCILLCCLCGCIFLKICVLDRRRRFKKSRKNGVFGSGDGRMEFLDSDEEEDDVDNMSFGEEELKEFDEENARQQQEEGENVLMDTNTINLDDVAPVENIKYDDDLKLGEKKGDNTQYYTLE